MNSAYSLFFKLPSFKRFGKIGKGIDFAMAKIVKRKLEKTLPAQYKTSSVVNSHVNDKQRETKYIASLTSFPVRINEIWVCIESILHQSFKPDGIELFLCEAQFPEKQLPESLLNLCQKGLSIIWVKENIRSYTKYYYAIQKHPNDCVITFDDDVYYPEDALQNLVELHEQYPNCICANRVHKIIYDKKGEIKPYRKWLHNYKGDRTPQDRLFLTGVGGVLYPPDSLDKEALNIEKAREICPLADDVWLNFSAYKKGTKIVGSGKYNKDFIAVGTTQKEKLVSKNVFEGGNDKQIQSVIEYFKIK